jgi:hypothetical protein
MIDTTKPTVVKLELAYDTETGAFEVKSNSQNQITLLGMLSMAKLGAKPPTKEPAIKVATEIPAGAVVPGHS